MSNNNDQDTFLLLPRYAACYSALAVIVAISIWLLLQLRVVIVQVGLAIGLDHYAMTVLDQIGFIILGVLWLIAFVAVEAYLRHGVPTNLLRSRIMIVFWWELVLTVGVFMAQQILT